MLSLNEHQIGTKTGQAQKEYGLTGWKHEKVMTKETASQTQVHLILCHQHGTGTAAVTNLTNCQSTNCAKYKMLKMYFIFIF